MPRRTRRKKIEEILLLADKTKSNQAITRKMRNYIEVNLS